MKIFDFNIHLPFLKHEDVNKVIEQDMSLDHLGIQKGFITHKDKIDKCTGVNILLFNTNLFEQNEVKLTFTNESQINYVKYTALVDFRMKNIYAYIDILSSRGVSAIMFNSYLQKIEDFEFSLIIDICKYASSKKLIICVDGSYGTSKMYTYDNMKLACYISDYITDTPIVIVHCGGRRIIDAFLLAEDKKNVWLDTSFSLPYYLNSSLEKDFAYVLKKMNTNRVVFGSDHPYIDIDDAISFHINFFEKYNFNDNEIKKILYTNALNLFNV